MIFGVAATAITFIASILSITAYYLNYKYSEKSLLSLARNSFYLSVILIFFQSALLMWGILNHRFEWIYVFSYSSHDLPLYYLISTFWAGQEGTFLLWASLGSIYGMVIIRNRTQDESLVMSFMLLVQAFIMLILVKRNPFAFVWEINPAAFKPGMIPVDGNGLNPLLQDPWMTIHPPILFAGYSSTMILFAFAMAALVKRNYNNWIKNVYPYALFVGLTLGMGIILGGYWAYTTLGWGGYWAWDPVENSSFIPWIVSLGLIHGIVVQKRQGGLKKTNIALALTTFILVLYGSFLTRSGILTDFSVHSFGESELSVYLLGFVLFFLFMGLLFFLFRANEFKGEKVQTGIFTRETFLLFGIIVFLVLATFTFTGTSSPLITSIFGEASNVSIDYYNTIAGPIGIIMALLIAIAPVLRWRKESGDKIKGLWLHTSLSLIAGIIIFIAGVREMIPLLIGITAFFVIFINGEIVIQMIRKKKFSFGGYLAHVGIGLMMFGIITSSVYDKSTKITLPIDTDVNIMGYDLRYDGRYPSPDGKDKVKIAVDNSITFAKFYWSDYSRAYMVAPSVMNMIFEDLYISPIQIIPADESIPDLDKFVIKKSETYSFENLTFYFAGYDMNTHGMSNGNVYVAAILDVRDDQGNILGTIKPALEIIGNESQPQPAILPGSNRKVFIQGINVEDGAISIGVTGIDHNPMLAGKELLAVEVSIKPFINILWLGTFLMIFGFITASINYIHSRRNVS
jgi:cytochrome c-type biogenesis protein CcmF